MIIDTTDSECIKEGLNALTDYFEAALQGEENKSTLTRMWKQQIGVLNAILDHPHAPPAHKEAFFEPLLNCECQVCRDAIEQHDATIHNRMLDELDKKLQECIEEHGTEEFMPDIRRGEILGLLDARMQIKSLRSTEAQQHTEVRR